MSYILQSSIKRQEVVFDPEDKQHRAWAYKALTSRCWGDIPVRFKTFGLDPMEASVKRKLLTYYMMEEFV